MAHDHKWFEAIDSLLIAARSLRVDAPEHDHDAESMVILAEELMDVRFRLTELKAHHDLDPASNQIPKHTESPKPSEHSK